MSDASCNADLRSIPNPQQLQFHGWWSKPNRRQERKQSRGRTADGRGETSTWTSSKSLTVREVHTWKALRRVTLLNTGSNDLLPFHQCLSHLPSAYLHLLLSGMQTTFCFFSLSLTSSQFTPPPPPPPPPPPSLSLSLSLSLIHSFLLSYTRYG